MRKLIVKRKWSIVECASKVYLYVQCAKRNSTHTINDVYYRAIRIKNGKTVEADILDEQPTMLIIGSSTANTPYTVPAGTDDVKLTVRPHYNPAEGNPFTFDTM